jgi:hypothetical protein
VYVVDLNLLFQNHQKDARIIVKTGEEASSRRPSIGPANRQSAFLSTMVRENKLKNSIKQLGTKPIL